MPEALQIVELAHRTRDTRTTAMKTLTSAFGRTLGCSRTLQLLVEHASSVYLPAFFQQVSMSMGNTLLPMFALRELHSNEATVGILVSLKAVGLVALNLPAGFLVQRFSVIKAVMAGQLCGVLVLLATALVSEEIGLIAVTALSGIGPALYQTARQTHVRQTVVRQDRGKAMSLMGGMGRAAQMCGPILGGTCAHYLGYRAAFLLQAGFAAVGALATFCARAKFRAAAIAATAAAGERGRKSGGSVAHTVWWVRIGAILRRYWRDLGSAGVFCMVLMVRACGKSIALIGSIRRRNLAAVCCTTYRHNGPHGMQSSLSRATTSASPRWTLAWWYVIRLRRAQSAHAPRTHDAMCRIATMGRMPMVPVQRLAAGNSALRQLS